MKIRIFIAAFLYCCAAVSAMAQEETVPPVALSANSPAWQARNAHLIPDAEATAAVLELDQDNDGVKNGEDPDMDGDGQANRIDEDMDGDGVPNRIDPSPYDHREIGYHPFGMLAFLSWAHPWNSYKYASARDLEKAVDILKELGVSFVRVDFYWQDLEPEKGLYDFGKYDELVALCARRGVRVLAMLHYSAGWASSAWNSPPDNDVDFVVFAQNVINRYKDRIKYWEIWNEPDSVCYWAPQDGMKRYADLLKKVYSAAKRVDPSCKVVLGGLTQGGYFALKNLYRLGAGGSFDIVNIHPFVNPLRPDPVGQVKVLYKGVRRLMEDNGDSAKKIWFTEIGCPGVRKPTKENGWWEGMSPTESQQAVFVRDVFGQVIDLPEVEKVFWAYFRDNDRHFNSGVDYFGLVRWDFSKKPAFAAYRNAARRWHPPED